jgi:hypothetical protein
MLTLAISVFSNRTEVENVFYILLTFGNISAEVQGESDRGLTPRFPNVVTDYSENRFRATEA